MSKFDAPTHEQLEDAWYAHAKGDLWLESPDEDPLLLPLVEAMTNYACQFAHDFDQHDGNGNVIDTVSGEEMARRIAVALSTISYGG